MGGEPRATSHAERRSAFERHYDREGDRLVYLGARADADFWDRRWLECGVPDYSGPVSRRAMVVRETVRQLEPGSLILEGGCGLAIDSWRLTRLGYRTLALDYALGTLERVGRGAPEVRPLAGDVTRLPLSDASVDGYWSLGVIEHFYEGYEGIREEMRRVVRPGGYLFLTFPALGWLRRSKAELGLYPRWDPAAVGLERFYQFALPVDSVVSEFEASGFRLARRTGYLGVTGLCEELGAVGRRLDRVLSGSSRGVRLLRATLDAVVRPASHHLGLLVLHRSAD